jgi:enamine deaminase RidA (YjgF/YER057c/UK114 family)
MTLVFNDANLRVDLTRAGTGQLYLVARVSPLAPVAQASDAVYRVLAEQLESCSAEVVHERVFGSVAVSATVLAARQRVWSETSRAPVPPTYIEGAPAWGAGLAGVLIHAVVPTATQSGVETLSDRSRPIGRRWTYSGVQELFLQGVDGLGPGVAHPDGSVDAELERLFDRIERLLGAHGTRFGNVVRTWFYLDGILPLYAAFNRVRSARYAAHGLLARVSSSAMLPASTGIGGKSPGKARVVADVFAIKGQAEAAVERLSSATQLDPTCYGSSFSRAAMLRTHDRTMIQVSGTGAIGEGGESLYPGDVEAQIECTLTHVSMLLEAHGATLSDTAAACMFLKRPEHALVLAEWLRRRGLDALPCVVVVADVCRDELLFEVDAEVLVPGSGP